MVQKYHKGDLVYIAKDLGSHASHFPSGVNAIVVGSYEDQFPQFSVNRTDTVSYTLRLPNGSTSSWYDERDLTLIHRVGEYELAGGQA